MHSIRKSRILINLTMLTLPNFITFLRFPLALAFFQENPLWRCLALILAMVSDALDGYFARRYGNISRFGTFLDPVADKFFVITALIVLVGENRLASWEAITMLCRDFSVIIFGCYLAFKGTLPEYQFRAIWCGKITTAMQLIVLFGLTCRIPLSPFVYVTFVALGLLALVELYLERAKLKVEI